MRIIYYILLTIVCICLFGLTILLPITGIAISVLALLFIAMLWLRNEEVYRIRMSVIEVARLYVFDSEKYDKIMSELHSTEYNTMLFMFWKPVKSFYSAELLHKMGYK